MDESIYAIAKTIQWQVLADITIRLRIIGKRMKSSGFKEIISRFQLFGCTNIEGTFSFFIKINVFSKLKNNFELSIELEPLTQETVSEFFFNNGMYWLLILYWRRLYAHKN